MGRRLCRTFVVCLYLISCCHSDGAVVEFPDVSPCRVLTNGPKEHLLASYYGINSWDLSQRYVTVLQTLVKDRIPTENDPATLALVDVRTTEFIPLVQTRAWNFQQGCMAHWLGTAPDSQIIYNDLRDGRFVSVVMDVHTKRELKVIDHPVSAVSPDGKEAISINFARLRITRSDYGYGRNGQDARRTVQFPDDDGLWSPRGDMIAFNSTCTGSRQIYLFDLKW